MISLIAGNAQKVRSDGLPDDTLLLNQCRLVIDAGSALYPASPFSLDPLYVAIELRFLLLLFIPALVNRERESPVFLPHLFG